MFIGLARLMAIAATALAGLGGAAEAQVPDPRNTTRIVDFPDCCPRPAWWGEVEIEARIGSIDEFSAIWRDDALTDRQKAKAMFRAIEEFVRRDDHITSSAVNYYYWVDRDYAHIRGLYEFGLGHFLDYDRPLQGYGGEVGDMSAGMVNYLAKIYLREGTPARAEPWLRYILVERKAEVNDHLLETAAVNLGRVLRQLGREPEAIAVLLEAKRDFDGDWEHQLDAEFSKLRERMGLRYYLYDKRVSGLVLAAVLAAILVIGVFWRRRPRLG